MKENICFLLNYAPHYRRGIFKLLSDEMNPDFYFCDRLYGIGDIKKIDYSELKGFKKEFRLLTFGRFFKVWRGLLSFDVLKHDIFVITPDQRNVSLWCLLLYSKLFNKKVVAWWHGIYPGAIIPRSLDAFLKKLFYKLVDGNLIYGEKSIAYMNAIGYPVRNAVPIYNSLDYDLAVRLRSQGLESNVYKSHFGNEYPVLVFIGRLTKVKRLDMLIDSHRMLWDRGIRSNLVLIGDGAERGELESLIRKDLEAYVWFVGEVYEECEIAKYLYNADICVSPGNVGLTGVHAMYYGLPTITNDDFTTQMPEHECILVGQSGCFFKKDSVADLVKTIDYWLNHSPDRNIIRQKCYDNAEKYYNPMYQVRAIESLISKLS